MNFGKKGEINKRKLSRKKNIYKEAKKKNDNNTIQQGNNSIRKKERRKKGKCKTKIKYN